jgi:hypothetical protein
MREAFVVTLGDGTDPARQSFAGWVEHVDTGRQRRFRTTDELLVFLADCVERPRSGGTPDGEHRP